VFDTNVFVRSFKSRNKSRPNRRVVQLWLIEKRLQLMVSPEVVAEYLEIFDEILEMDADVVQEWRDRFTGDARATLVNLARRDVESRDPDDNAFLSTARAAKAKYLVTNDKDLLDLTPAYRATVRFEIITPAKLLRELEEGMNK
jgi:putative PIN family toxin of toxin-antitoxin system